MPNKKNGQPKRRSMRRSRKVALKESTSLLDYKFSVRDAGSAVASGVQAVSYLAGLFNTEFKSFTTATTASTATITGAVLPISNVTLGDNFDQRNGSSLRLKSIYMAGNIHSSASDATGHIVRFLLVRDNACQGATPSVSDVIGPSYAGAALGVVAPVTFINEKRFEILSDQRIEASLSDYATRTFSVGIEDHGHILYLGSAGTAADQGLGSLFVMILTDNNTNAPNFDLYTRIRYVDN